MRYETNMGPKSVQSANSLDWCLQKRIVHRIGVETLWRHKHEPHRWMVALDNRTYHNSFEISEDKLTLWLKEFQIKK